MPLRTQKPCLRVEKKSGHYVVSAYPVVNRTRKLYKSIRIPLGDPQAFSDQVNQLIDEMRDRVGS